MPLSPPAAAVDFVVVGAMKAMTTSLIASLAEHPGIAASTVKETQFFVEEVGWSRGEEWYRSLFGHARPGQLKGEASPQYTFFPVYSGVPERIAESAPEARLVYLVRDPVARTLSQWRHAVDLSGEQRSLRQAVLHDARYQHPSRYWMQLSQYLRCFPEEQVLVVDSSRLAQEPAAVLREVVGHLGADPDLAPAHLSHLNAAEQRTPPPSRRRPWGRPEPGPVPPSSAVEPDPDLEDLLREVYAADARALGRFLGDAAPEWAR